MMNEDIELNDLLNPLVAGLRPNPVVGRGDNGFFLLRDNTPLFYRYWPAAISRAPSMILLCIHGMHSHSEPWIVLADYLVPNNIGVYAVDLRGHGLSGGVKGDINDYRIIIDDLMEVYLGIQQLYPGVPISIAGESMGGVFAIQLGTILQKKLSGLVLFAPAITPHRDLKIGIWFEILLSAFIGAMRKPRIPKGVSRFASHDEKYLFYAAIDDRRVRKSTGRYYYQILKMVRDLKQINTMSLPPTLVFLGTKDHLVRRKGCEELIHGIAHSDKAFHLIPHADHNLVIDFHARQYGMFEKLLEWLKSHLA